MKLLDHPLLKSHRGKPAILDSNLLLFSWCSSFDPRLVSSFKRLNSFQDADIELLSETLKIFSVLKTTPHVLTEVSNLANQLPYWIKNDWSGFFAKEISLISETHAPASDIATDLGAIRFGITDAALTHLACHNVVLTIDWPLSNLLESRGLWVINFNHLREAFLYS